MESAIYNAVISTNQILEKQAIISNNLANISNDGFKEIFNYTLNKNDKEDSYNNTIKEYYNFLPGTLKHTERNLDVFVKNNGWLTVRDKNGQEAYTKNGHLTINERGKLTIQNYEVVGNNCDIKIPNGAVLKILSNGTIKTVQKRDKDSIENAIGALKLVILPEKNLVQKENGLFYINNNNFNQKYKNAITHNKLIRLQSGILEESNVDISKNLVEMISNSRQFEMQIKIISMYDQNNEYANQLMNINS